MDRQELQRRLDQVAAYRGSGLKASHWAEVNGFPLKTLSSWCAHARRWQARLDGVPTTALAGRAPIGFVAAKVTPLTPTPGTVKIEFGAGGTRVDLHWPLTHCRELAVLLRELNR
jgi:hypothetical protein